MTKSRNINRPKFRWTPAAVAILERDYPNRPTQEIARRLRCALGTVYAGAKRRGFKKSAEFCASPLSGRIAPGNHDGRGREYRFQKGLVPANKGLRRPGWKRGRMGETQFKKGQRASNWMPINSMRVNADGYLDRKVRNDGLPQNRWVGVHRLVWIGAHGPIPPGHAVAFKPGRYTTWFKDITLDALELVSQRELMRRNTVHNLPKPLAQLVQLRGVLTRQINRRERRERE